MLPSERRNLLVWDLGAVWDTVTVPSAQVSGQDRQQAGPVRCFTQREAVCSGWQAGLAPSASVSQERLDAARQALSEARRQSSSLGEQVQTLQGELANLELQRGDAEGQLQQLQQVRPGGPLPIGEPVWSLAWGGEPISTSLQTSTHTPIIPQREPFGLSRFLTWASRLLTT